MSTRDLSIVSPCSGYRYSGYDAFVIDPAISCVPLLYGMHLSLPPRDRVLSTECWMPKSHRVIEAARPSIIIRIAFVGTRREGATTRASQHMAICIAIPPIGNILFYHTSRHSAHVELSEQCC